MPCNLTHLNTVISPFLNKFDAYSTILLSMFTILCVGSLGLVDYSLRIWEHYNFIYLCTNTLLSPVHWNTLLTLPLTQWGQKSACSPETQSPASCHPKSMKLRVGVLPLTAPHIWPPTVSARSLSATLSLPWLLQNVLSAYSPGCPHLHSLPPPGHQRPPNKERVWKSMTP